jgi:hypothetical protein
MANQEQLIEIKNKILLDNLSLKQAIVQVITDFVINRENVRSIRSELFGVFPEDIKRFKVVFVQKQIDRLQKKKMRLEENLD